MAPLTHETGDRVPVPAPLAPTSALTAVHNPNPLQLAVVGYLYLLQLTAVRYPNPLQFTIVRKLHPLHF